MSWGEFPKRNLQRMLVNESTESFIVLFTLVGYEKEFKLVIIFI